MLVVQTVKNTRYFVVYMALYWRSWKGCHFLAHPVYPVVT